MDPLEVALPDGSCIRPGVPTDGCAPGFEHDGAYGCNPVLPPEACPPGLMAVPGDNACRPVKACAAGRWGDIPIDATTQFVDAAYTGGANDGSEARPWTTINDAVGAAPQGGLVAIARGSYSEEVILVQKVVRLHGVCPDEVAIVSNGTTSIGSCPVAALCILNGADGSEVRGLGLRGKGYGIIVSGSQNVQLSELHVHDTSGPGIDVEDTLGVTAVTLADSLVEATHEHGVAVLGSDMVIRGTVVRDPVPNASSQLHGWGIVIEPLCAVTANGLSCDRSVRANVSVSGSLVERAHDRGIYISGADGSVEGSVVRGTLPRASDLANGDGILVQPSCDETMPTSACDPAWRGTAQVRRSLVEQNQHSGISVTGSEAVVEATIVRDTLPQASDLKAGYGVGIQPICPSADQCDPTLRAHVMVTTSLLERNLTAGVLVTAADAVIDASLIRNTLLRASDQTLGRGIAVQSWCDHGNSSLLCDPAARSNLVLTGSLVDQNSDAGVSVNGSDAAIEASVVRATLGVGLDLELVCDEVAGTNYCDAGARATGVLRNSLVDQSYEGGLFAIGADLTVEDSLVRATVPEAGSGLLGDGIVVVARGAPASANLWRTRVEDTARAGVSSFGASVSLGECQVRCAGFDLYGRRMMNRDATIDDQGGNQCGCPDADTACIIASASLEPPEPLEGVQ